MHSSETTLPAARRSRIGSRVIAILSTLAVAFGLSIVAPLAASADPLTGTITGTVTSSETNLPISGLVVQVNGENVSYQGTTNSSGTYEVTGVAPGDYTVYFAGPDLNYVEQYWQSSQTNAGKTLVTATAGTVTSGIDAVMTPGATISGRVVQAANPSVGIQNVQVSANEDEYGPGEAHTYTDAAGNYTLKGVSPGSYRVWFYGNGVDYADEIWQDAYTYQTATLLDVPAQASITGIDAALTVEAVVSGRVVNSADPTEGIEGVWVQLSDALGPVRGGQTDASGYYTIDALPEGTFTVQFQGNTAGYMNEYWENATSLSEATPLTLVAGAVVAGIDGSLDAAAAISGTVTAESSAAPLAGIWVYANREGGGGSGSATTDVDGNYFIGGLAAGDYRVNFNPNTQNYLDEYWDDQAAFDDATLIHLDAEAHAQNIDAALAAGSTISGNVKGDDGVTQTNLAGVQVYATTDWTVSQPSGSGYATTDAAGNFTINGLMAGEYQLEFDASGTGTEFAPAIRSELVTVGSVQDITGIQMTLGLGGRITGTVSGADAPTVGLQGIEVRIQDEGSAIYDYRSVYTGPDGTYSSAPLAPGTYRVTTALRWDSSLNYLGDTALVTVSGPGNVVRNWQLASGGKISGTVTGPGGVPQAGAQVEATNGNTSAWATTDSLGTYTIERLVTGPYTVSFQGGDSLATEWWQDSSSPGSATPVDVVAGGEVSGIDAELGQGSTISGTLLDGDGATVWAQAAVWDAATGIRVPIGFAIDEDGSYLISGLPVGSFKVGFSDRNSGDATDEYDDSGDLVGYHYQAAYLTGKTTKATADPITITAAGQALTGHNVTFVEVDQLKQFMVSPTPTISGALVEGRTLTATLGDWVPAVSHPQYRWLRDGVAIPFATTATYQLRAADVGHRISVTVTGSLIGYDASVTTSAETEPVVASGATVPLPTISGEARVGSTLLAHPGTWGPGSVDLAYQWTRNGAAISGAASVDYDLTVDDLGALIAVVVSGSAGGVHVADSISLVTAAIAEGAVTPGTVSIDGTPQVGLELTANVGTWNPTDVTFSYVWQSNGAPIVGETASTYTPTPDQDGKTISLVVTGTKAGYTDGTTTSLGVTVAPSAITSTTPAITGTPVVDGTLTAVPGGWGPPGVVLTYQWAVGGVDVTGETGTTYTPVAADVDSTITVKVTGTLAPRTPVTATSAETAPVAKAEFTTAQPTISGTVKVGETLTATAPAWTPEATALSYQWKADGADIGADSATLALTAAEAGKTISVTATGTRDGYTTAWATSNGTSEVAVGDLVPGAVAISGTPAVGSTLSADAGTWSPSGVAFAYQWAVGGEPVVGATGSTYSPVGADIGSTVTVTVTGSLAGYAPGTATSAANGPVIAGDLVLGTASVSGTAKVGETVTVDPGTWGPGTVALSYQWYSGAVLDANKIVGANGVSLVVPGSAEGDVLVVVVTGQKAGYTTETVQATTASVVADEFVTAAPTISGTPKVGQTLTVTVPNWTPLPTSTTLQWYADGVAIPGATGTTVVLGAAQLDKRITVEVTGSRTGYQTATATSVQTAPVAAGEVESTRLSGDTRFETAVAVSASHFEPGVERVYLANGYGYPDALSAAPAAAHFDAPLLLTMPDSVPAAVVAEIERLQPAQIVIVGGTGAVSAAVANALSSLSFGPEVKRVSGTDRYLTSQALALDTWGAGEADTAYVATGTDFPDALSASPAAAHFDGPVVLVPGNASSIDTATRNLFTTLGVEKVKIAGGTGVVSSAIETQLKNIFGATGVTRNGGSDRYATSVTINADSFSSATTVYLAVGTGYADALAGAALAGTNDSPLFTTMANCVPQAVLDAIEDLGAINIVLLGGSGVLTPAVENLTSCG